MLDDAIGDHSEEADPALHPDEALVTAAGGHDHAEVICLFFPSRKPRWNVGAMGSCFDLDAVIGRAPTGQMV
jgi:hypothetical protein